MVQLNNLDLSKTYLQVLLLVSRLCNRQRLFTLNFHFYTGIMWLFILSSRSIVLITNLDAQWRLRKIFFKRSAIFSNSQHVILGQLWKQGNYNIFAPAKIQGLILNSKRRWNRFNSKRKNLGYVHAFKYMLSKKKISVFAKSYFCVPVRGHTFTHVNTFSLRQRYFLTLKNIRKTIWLFLYVKVKKTFFKNDITTNQILHSFKSRGLPKKSLFFVNLYKKLLWKMRKARYAHWQYRTTGKLNEWRYNKLLSHELYNLSKSVPQQFLIHIIFRSFFLIVSWRQVLALMSFNLFILNGNFCSNNFFFKKGDILELPLSLSLAYDKSKLKKINIFKKNTSKAKKTIYNFYKKKGFRVMFSQKLPKIFKKIPIGYKNMGSFLAVDNTINVLTLLFDFNKTSQDLSYSLTNNSVLTLQNWRYRFD